MGKGRRGPGPLQASCCPHVYARSRMHTGHPQASQDTERAGAQLTFGPKQRGVAWLVAERFPIMLGRG